MTDDMKQRIERIKKASTCILWAAFPPHEEAEAMRVLGEHFTTLAFDAYEHVAELQQSQEKAWKESRA